MSAVKVTIEGTMEQVSAALGSFAPPARPRKNKSLASVEREKIAERRKILCRAFKLTRNDPAQSFLARRLLAAITGKDSATDKLIDEATLVVLNHEAAND